MIPVFFNNQNYTFVRYTEARDMIVSAKKDDRIKTYLACWQSLFPVTDKVKLEKWWLNNHHALLKEPEVFDNKEVFELLLTPEQKAMNLEDKSLEQWEIDLMTEYLAS
jgi:hypothetical protein